MPSKKHLLKRVRVATPSLTYHYPNDLYEANSGSASVTKHVFLNGNDVAEIVGNTGSSTTDYNFVDHLGSINVTADQNNRVQETTDYAPYGKLNNYDQINAYSSLRKHIGQDYDNPTGFSYLNARFYDGNRGQFLSQDTVFIAMGDRSKLKSLAGLDISQQLKNPQKLNSYNYSQDNPITHEDPSGLDNDFGLTNFFNSYDPTAPAEVNQYIAQAKAQAPEASVAVPLGAQTAAGFISSEAIAPELFPVMGVAYQGASFDVASRATHNAMTGEQSTWGQYAGSAVIGGFTGGVTAGAKLPITMGATFASSGFESSFVDGSFQLSKAFSDSIAAGGGEMAGRLVSSIPALEPAAPALEPLVENATAYSISVAWDRIQISHATNNTKQ